MEDYKQHGLHVDVPVSFNYVQMRDMEFKFKDID